MAEKKLPDITRRQFLKGAAKVAGATALPGSGLASIGEAVKMGLDINQKLDLTKNILQGLAQNELSPRELRIFTYLQSFTSDGGRQVIAPYLKTGPLDKYDNPEKYQKDLFKQITENRIPPIIGSGGEFVDNKDFLEAPTLEEINTILDKKSNQSKLFDAVTEYNLPLNAVRKTDVQDKTYGIIQDGGFLSYKDTLENFSNIKNTFLQEYKDGSSPIVEFFKKTETLQAIENKIKKKYNLNDVELQDIIPTFQDQAELEGIEEIDPELVDSGLKRTTGLTFKDLQDPLFKEYNNLKEDMFIYQGQNLYQKGDVYDHTYHNSFKQREIKDALNIGKNVLDFALDQGQKYVGKKLYEKLRPGEQEQIEENQNPKAIEGPKLSDTQTIEGEAKRIPEPEGLNIEVENAEEIQQKNPVLAQRIVNLLGKSIRRSPYVFGLTPTKVGYGEIQRNPDGTFTTKKRKGGPVMRNYNKNYNTQRTI